MIINNNPTPDVSALNLDQTQGSSRAAIAGASQLSVADSSPGDDSISLSNSANLVQQALASTSSVRLARTQDLKALVQNNQYQPSAQELGSALIDAHLRGD
jgi:hypothetical protein